MGCMRRAALRPAWRSGLFFRRYSTVPSSVLRVPAADISTCGLDTFRKSAFVPERPLLIKAETGAKKHAADSVGDVLPAIGRWFVPEAVTSPGTISPYLEQFSMAFFPYEIICPPCRAGVPNSYIGDNHEDALETFCSWLESGPEDGGLRWGLAKLVRHHRSSAAGGVSSGKQGSGPEPEQRLIQLHAPLALLIEALRYNQEAVAATGRTTASSVSSASSASSMPVLTQLYIAQASLSELPAELRDDVPTPRLVQDGGRGDVYDTSLWLGLEPTYTPWHRDPNPNLFCQLCSGKTVRLSPPAAGEQIFRQVQAELARRAASTAAAAVHSRIRGDEMMQGPERRPLHDAIWARAHATDANLPAMTSMHEAHVEPGDMLFIPKGWWHSVKSGRADGRLNASVNWWFR